MGEVRVKVEISNPADPKKSLTTEALVDTGSTYSEVSAQILRSLGIEPVEKRRYELANGRTGLMDVGYARVRIQGEVGTTPIGFQRGKGEPLVGLVTLELLGFKVDPIDQVLVPRPIRKKRV